MYENYIAVFFGKVYYSIQVLFFVYIETFFNFYAAPLARIMRIICMHVILLFYQKKNPVIRNRLKK